MQIAQSHRRGTTRAAVVAILAGLVGGCVGQSEPAPVYLRGAGEPFIAPMPPPGLPPTLQVVVKRGQTLDGYAYTYHLPKSAIIVANGLRPPYKLEAGQQLIIPNPHNPVQQQAMTPPPPAAARPWSPPPPQQAAIVPAPRPPGPLAMPAPASQPPQTIFPTPTAAAPTQPIPPPQAALAPTASAHPSSAASPETAKYLPEIIPLDGPPPKVADAAPAKSGTLTPPSASAPQQAMLSSPPPAGSPSANPPGKVVAGLPVPSPAGTQADAQPIPGGRFPWPVRGRIVGAYGNTPGGGHNDGINISAPLGTPVRAIDSGAVVYSGNEVKGYGNIVLIRHPNGWISAYAHLDDVTVKPGDNIAAGEVIAKVGNSGGITEPQLHFELRRGKKPVNPTEFLAPSPSAQGGAGNRAG